MLVLNKENRIRNVNATFDSSTPEKTHGSTQSISLWACSLNVLNADQEKIFMHALKTDPELKYQLEIGKLRIITTGPKRDLAAEAAALEEAETEAMDAAAALETASKPADKQKAQKALTLAQTKVKELKAEAEAPIGAGETLPKTLDKITDPTMAAEMVEGVIDLGQLNAWLLVEKRNVVKEALKRQIEMVKAVEEKAKELQAQG